MENNNEQEKKQSWLSKNAWWIVVGIILFIIKMCTDLQK